MKNGFDKYREKVWSALVECIATASGFVSCWSEKKKAFAGYFSKLHGMRLVRNRSSHHLEYDSFIKIVIQLSHILLQTTSTTCQCFLDLVNSMNRRENRYSSFDYPRVLPHLNVSCIFDEKTSTAVCQRAVEDSNIQLHSLKPRPPRYEF